MRRNPDTFRRARFGAGYENDRGYSVTCERSPHGTIWSAFSPSGKQICDTAESRVEAQAWALKHAQEGAAS